MSDRANLQSARTSVEPSVSVFPRRWRAAFATLFILTVPGCGTVALPPAEPAASDVANTGAADACSRFLRSLDAAVGEAGVGDAQTVRIPGFPYVRLNRFLASDIKPDPESPALAAWIARLRDLDREARGKEVANLPPPDAVRLRERLSGESPLIAEVQRCGEILAQADLTIPSRRTDLVKGARVADSYNPVERVVGLYPVTSLFFLGGVDRLHVRLAEDFRTPLSDLAVTGKLVRLNPPTADGSLPPSELAAIIERTSRNPLGIPEPTGGERAVLFGAFAPIWEVDVSGEYDLIGTPAWRLEPIPDVDATQPAVFRHISHVRVGASGTTPHS